MFELAEGRSKAATTSFVKVLVNTRKRFATRAGVGRYAMWSTEHVVTTRCAAAQTRLVHVAMHNC